MSNVINFNAREFKFDTSCTDNVGSRMFLTDSLGNNIECWEIGNWEWSWTQICCDKVLEKNTDYVFRFAMTGGYNNTFDATSILRIIPDGNEDECQSYQLAKSAYSPAISKAVGDEMLRVYEIPFNTGDCENFRFVMVAMHAVARFMPAYELERYAEFEDYTYAQWKAKATENNANTQNSFGKVLDLSGAVITKEVLEKVTELVEKGICVDLSGAVIGDN